MKIVDKLLQDDETHSKFNQEFFRNDESDGG
jgi:hypothetical protein